MVTDTVLWKQRKRGSDWNQWLQPAALILGLLSNPPWGPFCSKSNIKMFLSPRQLLATFQTLGLQERLPRSGQRNIWQSSSLNLDPNSSLYFPVHSASNIRELWQQQVLEHFSCSSSLVHTDRCFRFRKPCAHVFKCSSSKPDAGTWCE